MGTELEAISRPSQPGAGSWRWQSRSARSSRMSGRWTLAACIIGLLVFSSHVGAQLDTDAPLPPPAATPEGVVEDVLDRQTPRGAVFGFLAAARDDNFDLARQYLDTRESDEDAARLAEQLYVVLDARLEARLVMISERAEGSRANPLKLNEEVVGSVDSRKGRIDIVLRRTTRAGTAPIWLFARSTLTEIPDLYDEVIVSRNKLPPWFTSTRLRGVPIVEWIGVLLLIPGLYVSMSFLNRLLTPAVGALWRNVRRAGGGRLRAAVPGPVRLVLVALLGRWLLSSLSFSLGIRQAWSLASSLVGIAAIVWVLLLINRGVESYARRHLPAAGTAAAISLIRLIRRIADVIMVFGGIVGVLIRFGIDPTPALAGLGVGGIAVALAAQKTLENVIAGVSLIFDQAVNVGDYLKMNEVVGTVERIGLRSTRIRTLDRTIVSVPNSVLANGIVETFSARDKFWFHPVIGLSYETKPDQMQTVLEGLRQMLREHESVDPSSVRVRFTRLGPSSLDIDISAYLTVPSWDKFLAVQESLLQEANELVERAGTQIALPSQTTYFRAVKDEEAGEELPAGGDDVTHTAHPAPRGR